MAFSKAKTKRFNEVFTCAPPPGYYDPKIKTRQHGIYLERTERFKSDAKEMACSSPPSQNKYKVPQDFHLRSSGRKLLPCRSLMDIAKKGKKGCFAVWDDNRSVSSLSEDHFNVEIDILKSQLSSVRTDLEIQKNKSWDLMRLLAAYEEILAVKEQEGVQLDHSKLPSVVNLDGSSAKYTFEGAVHDKIEIDPSQVQDVLNINTNLKRDFSEEIHPEYIISEVTENALVILNECTSTLNTEKVSLSVLLSVLADISQLYENEKIVYIDPKLDMHDLYAELRKIVSFVSEKVLQLAHEREILDFTCKGVMGAYEEQVKELKCYTTTLEKKNSDLTVCLIDKEKCNTELCINLLTKEKNETMQNEALLKLEEENMRLKNLMLAEQAKHENEIGVLIRSLEDATFLNEKLCNENKSILKEKHLLSSQNELLKREIEGLHELNVNKEHELSSLSVDLKAFKENFVYEQDKVCKLNDHAAELILDISRKDELVAKLQTEVNGKSFELSGLQSRIVENDNAIQKMCAEKDKCIEDLIQFKDKCRDLVMINDTLTCSLKTTADENNHLKENSESLTDEVMNLHTKLETMIEDNGTLSSSLKAVTDENKQLEENAEGLTDEIMNLHTKLETMMEDNDILEKAICSLKDEKNNLLLRLEQHDQLIKERTSNDEKHVQFVREICGHFDLLKEDMDKQKEILLNELLSYTERFAELQADHEKYKSVINEEIEEMLKVQYSQEQHYKEKISFLESIRNEIPLEAKMQLETSEAEKEKWKTQFLSLEAKVSPFKKQLDAYELEKNSLLSQNIEKEHELENLGDKYAKLLGHQNINQKIKHVVKIKEENFNLKKELGSLKEKVSKQCKLIGELKTDISSMGHKKQKGGNILKVKNT